MTEVFVSSVVPPGVDALDHRLRIESYCISRGWPVAHSKGVYFGGARLKVDLSFEVDEPDSDIDTVLADLKSRFNIAKAKRYDV